jgi:hypothetical protein
MQERNRRSREKRPYGKAPLELDLPLIVDTRNALKEHPSPKVVRL